MEHNYRSLYVKGYKYLDLLEGEEIGIDPKFPRYRISSLGFVFRTMHHSCCPNQATVGFETVSQHRQNTGYLRVRIENGVGLKKTVCVHQLVARAFLRKSGPSKEVDHIDGDKSNNHVSNLEWVTKSENHKRRWRRQKGEGWVNKDWSNKTGRTRLKLRDAKDIRASGQSPEVLAAWYGKHVNTIRRILWNKILAE